MSLNAEKSYSMAVSKKKSPLICKLTANRIDIKQVEKFNYLGSFLKSDGKSDYEIKRRIALNKAAFKKKRAILMSLNITISTRQNLISGLSFIWMRNIKCELLQTIKKRKMTFLGHVMRRNSIENLSLTGKVEGKRARGRQRMAYLNNVKDWANITNGSDLTHACQDREVWKHMIADALWHDTQRRRRCRPSGVFTARPTIIYFSKCSTRY